MNCFNPCNQESQQQKTVKTTNPKDVYKQFHPKINQSPNITSSTGQGLSPTIHPQNDFRKKMSVRKSLYEKNQQAPTQQFSLIKPKLLSSRDDLGDQDFKQLKGLLGSMSGRQFYN